PPGVGFVLFGDGPLRERLSHRIAALGLQENFILAGFRHDIDRLMPFLDLLVLPSFTEGMPNVVLEAMAAGVPVVATAVGGTPELVVDGVTGYLVSAGHRTQLARRMREVLTDERLGQAMGRQGRQRVAERFSFEAQSRAYQLLFDELCSQQKGMHDISPELQ